VLDVQVRELAAANDRIVVVPHEVPLLGVPSQFAARAVIAAEEQGADDAFHRRLIRTTFVPNPAYLREIADEEGLDVGKFERDMQSEATTMRINDSIALFRAFGFVGTPALAVGRTLVNGAISRADLRALMRLELAQDTPMACR
jgi:predicted DsbA family dithiol-disulfide isomerase